MFHLVLYRPEIPPNTGNAIRLCANTGCTLHLVGPLGYTLEEPQLRRAGLDYHDLACVRLHADLAACRAALPGARWFAIETGGAKRHVDVAWQAGDALLFGQETAGLPADVLAQFDPGARVSLPMRPGNRSLNLSNAVAVAAYEAWRQLGFPGAGGGPDP